MPSNYPKSTSKKSFPPSYSGSVDGSVEKITIKDPKKQELIDKGFKIVAMKIGSHWINYLTKHPDRIREGTRIIGEAQNGFLQFEGLTIIASKVKPAPVVESADDSSPVSHHGSVESELKALKNQVAQLLKLVVEISKAVGAHDSNEDPETKDSDTTLDDEIPF